MRGFALLGIAASLAGCLSPRASQSVAAVRAPDSFKSARSFAGNTAPWPGLRWWTAYPDRQLGLLIDEALKDSPDVAAAAARLHNAQGFAEEAGAALLPSLDGDSSAGLTKQSYNNGFPAFFLPQGWRDQERVEVNFKFDLDFWGRNRAALAAAISDQEAARIELADAQLVLSVNVGAAYADLAQLYAERDVQELAINIRSQTFRLVSHRVLIGVATQADLKQAESAVPAAQADLAATDEAIGLTRDRLAALMGDGPDRGLAIARPSIAGLQFTGLPPDLHVNLIGRRPDIAAARARVEAAASRIVIARADFYPDVSLQALVGYESLGIGSLFRASSVNGNFGPAISLPIFRGGELNGRYEEARGRYEEAVANYNGTLAQALREVADTATSRRMLGIRLARSRQSLASAEQANVLARDRYAGGLSTYLDVLSAEDGLLQRQRNVADLEARAFQLDVSMTRALGGGFLVE